MSNIELTFIILNAAVIGSIWALVAFVLGKGGEVTKQRELCEAAVSQCTTLVKVVGEAHNGLAKRILDVEDKTKAQELRNAQKAMQRV